MAVELQHVSKLLRLLSVQGDVPVPARVWKVETQPFSHKESECLPTTGGPVVVHRAKWDDLDHVACDPRSWVRFIADR